MKKRRLALTFLWCSCILIPLACSTPQTGPAADTDDFGRVNNSVNKLTNSYEKEDTGSFMGTVGKDYDLDYSALERTIQDEFDRYSAFDVSIIVDRVSTDSSRSIIFADTRWTKRRVSLKTGSEDKKSGKTTFIFRITRDGNLVLKGMKGDRLYGEP
jgi:hypothetical protein